MRSCTVPKSSSAPISTRQVSSISPVSMPSFIYIVVMPVNGLPSIIARCMGAAPRYSGSNEPCTFMQPYFGSSSTSAGSILPYAATTMRFAPKLRSSSNASGVRNVRG